MMLYFAVLFFVYCLALVSPALFAIASQPVSGPEQEALAREAAHRGLGGGRIWIAVLAAAVTLGLGIWARVLPGFRRQV
jgi:hypothetical protein